MNNLSNKGINIFNQKLNKLSEKEKEYNKDLVINNLASKLLNERKDDRLKILESLNPEKKKKVEDKLKILIKEKTQESQKNNLYNNILPDLENNTINLDNSSIFKDNKNINIKNIIKKENSFLKKNKLLKNTDWNIKKIKNKYIYVYKNKTEFDSNKYNLRKYYKTNNIVLYNKNSQKEYNINELNLLIQKKQMHEHLKKNGWTIKKKYNRIFYIYNNTEFDTKYYKIYKYNNVYVLYNIHTKKIIPLEDLKNSTLSFWQKFTKTFNQMFGVNSSSVLPFNLNSLIFLIFIFTIFLYVFENLCIIIIRYITENLHDYIFYYFKQNDFIDDITLSEIFIINIEDWIWIRVFLPVYLLFYIFFNFILRGYGWYTVSYLITSIFIFIGIFRGILSYNGINT